MSIKTVSETVSWFRSAETVSVSVVIRDLEEMPWIGENCALDLANTIVRNAGTRPDVDFFTDARLLHRWRSVVDRRIADVPTDQLVEWRSLVRESLVVVGESGNVPARVRIRLNALAEGAPVVLKMDEGGVVRHVDRADCPPDAVVARETLRLIGSTNEFAVRLCDAPSCGMFFVPRRRNQEWCTTRCGARVRSSRRYEASSRLE
ncbi:hypothetical protein G4H71_17370 [Rhodococcus triatomae]|uniref:CGNR zinc finger domain-containing protein n=1 Tax=Rhodococcus triatomae TaxID=300028 RepID=UPI001626D50D|nr:CGNR zinc finger domain-containing protein [Rhodococcus triatomae]QNG19509.1 hypothetical protein G4H72_13005 [Rhodococcus triatomae]QNG24576.1 hypothetical protein G4H71_17370 [Rhodococcus triatomae]